MLWYARRGPFNSSLKLKVEIFQLGWRIREKNKIRHKFWMIKLQKSGLSNYFISCMYRLGRITVEEILLLLADLRNVAVMQTLVGYHKWPREIDLNQQSQPWNIKIYQHPDHRPNSSNFAWLSQISVCESEMKRGSVLCHSCYDKVSRRDLLRHTRNFFTCNAHVAYCNSRAPGARLR